MPLETGPDGVAYNTRALDLMAAGASPQEAVDAATGAVPDADVGLIAIDWHGRLGIANSARVARRPDLGVAQAELPNGARVGVLHNAIRPVGTLAPLVADIALEAMGARPRAKGTLRARVGTTLDVGAADAVEVDDAGMVTRIWSSNVRAVHETYVGGVIGLGAEVRRGGEVIGRTLSEPNVVTENGRTVLLNGAAECEIAYG